MRTIAASLMAVLLAVPGAAYAQSTPSVADLKKIHGKEVAVVDEDGVERVGRLTSITDSSVVLDVLSGPHTFESTKIYKIERLHDESLDGFIKGATAGLLLALIGGQGYETSGDVIYGALMFGGLGYWIDQANDHRQLVYQAPRKPAEKRVAANVFQFRF